MYRSDTSVQQVTTAGTSAICSGRCRVCGRARRL